MTRQPPPAFIRGAALARVVQRVADALGLDPAAVAGRARGCRRTVLARQVAMYIAIVCLEYLQRDVARVFNRSRTAVGHNVRVIEDRRDDPAFDAWLARIEVASTQIGRGRLPPSAQ